MSIRFTSLLFLIYGLLLAALITRNGDLALAAAPFMVYLAAGLLSAPQEIRLEAARTLSASSAQPGTPVHMQVVVHNQGQAAVYLHLADELLPGLQIVDGEREARLALPAGGTTELDYVFQGARGQYNWATLHGMAADAFGLFEHPLEVPCPGQVYVFPERIRLRRLPLKLQRTMPNPGPYPARRGGPGSDFWGVRPYHLGDPMRWIHWRLSRRYPGSFFTKEFEREEPADIGLILDPGPTSAEDIEASLFEHSTRAAAALAEAFLGEGNRVGMLNLSGGMRYVFPGSGKAQLVKIMRHLSCSGEGANGSLAHIRYLPVRLFPSRSLIVVISPVSGADLPASRRVKAFGYLKACGYQVLLLSPDPVSFAARSLPPSTAAGLAVRAARIERSLYLNELRQMGVEVIEWQVDQPLAKVLHTALLRQRTARVG